MMQIVKQLVSVALVLGLLLPSSGAMAQVFSSEDRSDQVTREENPMLGNGGDNDTGTIVGLSILGGALLVGTGIYLWHKFKDDDDPRDVGEPCQWVHEPRSDVPDFAAQVREMQAASEASVNPCP